MVRSLSKWVLVLLVAVSAQGETIYEQLGRRLSESQPETRAYHLFEGKARGEVLVCCANNCSRVCPTKVDGHVCRLGINHGYTTDFRKYEKPAHLISMRADTDGERSPGFMATASVSFRFQVLEGQDPLASGFEKKDEGMSWNPQTVFIVPFMGRVVWNRRWKWETSYQVQGSSVVYSRVEPKKDRRTELRVGFSAGMENPVGYYEFEKNGSRKAQMSCGMLRLVKETVLHHQHYGF